MITPTFNSNWLSDNPSEKRFPILKGNIECDYGIVGGGMTGLMSAYFLSNSLDKKIVVIDKGDVGLGETSYSTSFLMTIPDKNYSSIISKFGVETGKKVCFSLKKAISMIEDIIKKENIECDFKRIDGYIYAETPEQMNALEKEISSIGIVGIDYEIHRDDLLGFNNFGYLKVKDQATFNPRLFLKGLISVLEKRGVLFYENTTAIDYCCTNPTKILTKDGEISCKYSLIATHIPNNAVYEIVLRLVPMQTYAFKMESTNVFLPSGLYLSFEDNYHYFRVEKEGEGFILVGGEDHKTGETPDEDTFEKLEKYALTIFGNGNLKISEAWAGQYFYSADGLPFIGRSTLNSKQLISTGYGGDGLLFGTIGAMVMSDIALENNEYKDLQKMFSPIRFTGGAEILKKGIKVTKGIFVDRLKFNTPRDIENLKLDEGKVLRIKGRYIATYKGSDGRISKVSGVCTHQNCILKWNNIQKTWECPCHGSVFSKTGKVLSGPANKDLEEIK